MLMPYTQLLIFESTLLSHLQHTYSTLMAVRNIGNSVHSSKQPFKSYKSNKVTTFQLLKKDGERSKGKCLFGRQILFNPLPRQLFASVD